MTKEFVFIVTYGRSGSTLLQKIVGSIENCHIAGENNNALFGLYQSYTSLNNAKRRFGQNYTNYDEPWYGADLFGPERYGRKLVRMFIDEVLNPPENASIIGFKEIRYFENPGYFLQFLKFIKHFFAPAKYIFNVRDCQEVSKSGWWKEQSEDSVCNQIMKNNEMMEEFISLFPEACIKVNYNEYTKNHLSLESVYDFLGREFDPIAVTNILSKKLTH